jgi:hypothetical protein
MAVPPVSFRPTAHRRPLALGADHRPSPLRISSLGPRLWPLARPAHCLASQRLLTTDQLAAEQLAAGRLRRLRRLRRFALEGLATAMATGFLTSLALAHPAVLRDAPITTLERIATPLLGAGGSATPLGDCP